MLSPALRRFLPYLRPHAHLVVLTLAAAIVSLSAATAIPLVIKAIIDGPVTQRHAEQLAPYAALILALALFECASNFTRRYFSILASLRMETELRNEFYAHLQALQVGFHDSWQSGQLLSRAIADIQALRRFVGFGLVFASFFGILWVAVLAMLLRLDWRLALLSALAALPVLFASRSFFRRYAAIARSVQDQQGDVATVVEETATGVRVVKAFGREPLLKARFQAEAGRLRAINLNGVEVRAKAWTWFSLVPNLTLAVVLLVGGFAVSRGELSIGGLVAFMTYLFMLVWPLDALGWVLAMGEEATTAARRLSEVLDVRPEIRERPGARPLARARGAVRFDRVGFRYPGTGEWILRGLDLNLAPGETVALVGATGSGKSTVAALVPRLHDATEGRVTLDGYDIRDLTLRSLRAQVGMAFEDPILFSASVHENLLMGRPAVSQLQVRRALELARAEFVWELPWGLETRIGEQGHSLSGGQRQRLALARAVLSSPRVLVLDDPLSSVDVHTEREIEEALTSMLGGVTALLVAHRPSTLAAGAAGLMATSQSADSWRGVAAEELDDLPAEVSARYRRRSRRLLASLLAPRRGPLLLAAGLMLLRTGGTLAIPYLVGQAIDRGIRAGSLSVLELYAALVVIAAVAAGLGNWAFLRVAGRIGQDFLYDLRMRIYTHVQALSISFYERYTSGRIISRLTNDIETLTDLLATGLTSLATATLSIVAIAVVLLLLDWRLGAVTLLTFPLILLLTHWFRANSSRAYRAVRQAIALVIVHFTESLGGIRAVQAYSREDRNQQIFEELDARYRDANALSVRLNSTYAPGISLLGRLATLTVLTGGGLLVLRGSLTLGVLTAFVLYVRQFFEPMQDLTQFYNLFQAAAAALEKLAGVLEERPAVPEPAQPVRLGGGNGSLEFSDVTFAYQEVAVLHGLSFSVPAGQTLALVGRTGAGKSTIARLMARFYDPTRGLVRLDGVDLREIGTADLRRAVIMVTQESFLFSGSIAENIGFGRPEASREEIEAAARAVGADSFVERLPQGYDTEVRRRGVRLSAGQRQLVAFARAFLAEPRVLILDEATSSLDVPSERLVQRALGTLLAGRTAVIIAHRLSTVEIADRVLVVEGGEVVEDGPPAALVRSGGRYHELQRAWLESLA